MIKTLEGLRVLVACEFSGTVRDAFSCLGADAWSCDLLPTESHGQHFQQDIFTPDGEWNLPADFDLIIAHPPCTHLAVSGARWFADKKVEQRKAIWFFMALVNAPAPCVCVENPISIISTHYRKPDQIIHPWQFGHTEQKSTCLWLNGLPKLVPTNDVKQEMLKLPKKDRERLHYLSPSPDRWKLRSKTYHGIAEAMAHQWGSHCLSMKAKEKTKIKLTEIKHKK